MRRLLRVSCSGSLVLSVLALAGCGGSGSGSSSTIKTIDVKSAAVVGTSIPVRYTCDGADTTPPVEWGTVPAGTESLVLFVVGVEPEPSTKTFRLSVDWAVAGLNPALHRMAPGVLPPGAFVGVAANGKRGYSICPKKGPVEQFQFELYALPAGDSISRKFAGLPILVALANPKSSPATGHGDFIVKYRRA